MKCMFYNPANLLIENKPVDVDFETGRVTYDWGFVSTLRASEWEDLGYKFVPVQDKNRDEVNKPHHYNTSGLECIQAIEAALSPEEYRGYIKGNIMKYTWREAYKKKDEDLKKAQWYLNRYLDTYLKSS